MPPKPIPDSEIAEAAAAAAAEMQRSQMVASTFANIELETTRATLAQYVTLYEAARNEVMKLQHEMDARDKDSMTVVQFLRADLDARQEQLKEQRKKAAEELKMTEDKMSAMEAALKEGIRERDNTITELQHKVDSLEADLQALNAFTRERERMHEEFSKLREDHQHMIDHYEAELSRQRFLSLEEKVRLKAQERQMLESFEAQVNDRALKLLDGKSKEIRAENFNLLKEKASLEHEVQRVTDAYQIVSRKTQQQQQACELAKMADTEYAKKSVAQVRENRELHQRCSTLESNISKLVQTHANELDVLKNTHAAQLGAAISERDDALRAAQLVQRDYLKMRQLTRSVVKQRTEMETFFNEALDYVRTEIEREAPRTLAITDRSAKHRADPSSGAATSSTVHGTTGVPIRGAAARQLREKYKSIEYGIDPEPTTKQSSVALPAIARVTQMSTVVEKPDTMTHSDPEMPSVPSRLDISDLSWRDKERVLRILFAKINSVSAGRNQPAEKSTTLPALQNGGRSGVCE